VEILLGWVEIPLEWAEIPSAKKKDPYLIWVEILLEWVKIPLIVPASIVPDTFIVAPLQIFLV
jgi:hypothetical protein